MGSMDATDYSFNHSHQRQCGYIAAVLKRQLPKISSADTRYSRSNLLFRMESIDELRPKKYSTKASNDGCCISRSI